MYIYIYLILDVLFTSYYKRMPIYIHIDVIVYVSIPRTGIPLHYTRDINVL